METLSHERVPRRLMHRLETLCDRNSASALQRRFIPKLARLRLRPTRRTHSTRPSNHGLACRVRSRLPSGTSPYKALTVHLASPNLSSAPQLVQSRTLAPTNSPGIISPSAAASVLPAVQSPAYRLASDILTRLRAFVLGRVLGALALVAQIVLPRALLAVKAAALSVRNRRSCHQLLRSHSVSGSTTGPCDSIQAN